LGAAAERFNKCEEWTMRRGGSTVGQEPRLMAGSPCEAGGARELWRAETWRTWQAAGGSRGQLWVLPPRCHSAIPAGHSCYPTQTRPHRTLFGSPIMEIRHDGTNRRHCKTFGDHKNKHHLPTRAPPPVDVLRVPYQPASTTAHFARRHSRPQGLFEPLVLFLLIPFVVPHSGGLVPLVSPSCVAQFARRRSAALTGPLISMRVPGADRRRAEQQHPRARRDETRQ
jgi:hypothetical protein